MIFSLLPGAPEWRREALRTNLWVVPTLEVLIAICLFVGTHEIDKAASHGRLTLPAWMLFGGADAARQILASLAAAVITVVGVVFSITMVTLTLASTQFGPRMLRNFIRDRATQFTLGTFVATFVYATLVLISISPNGHGGDFVPNLSITVSVCLVMVSMGVLIYFIHHTARSIQLPHVIASIATDLTRAIAAESSHQGSDRQAGPSVEELLRRMSESGGTVLAPSSGYLQFVQHDTLTALAVRNGAVIRLLYRPGHFLVRAHPLATVWPPAAAESISSALARAHLTGSSRTLAQDLSFAVDQLVEIALRALSPAVNDTFTALTCIDWLGASLCRVTEESQPLRVHRDSHGFVRLITADVSYRRLTERAFEKIRQAGRGMPAVMIRQLDALAKIGEHTTRPEQRDLLLEQANMIRRACEESVPEPSDRADVMHTYQHVLAVVGASSNGRAMLSAEPPVR